MAAVDLFLAIDGIEGESADAKHKGAIHLDSFSWGEASPATQAGGAGGGPGKVQIQDLHVAMRLSKASPQLLLACATGQHIKQAVLTGRKAGATQFDFLVVKLTDVLVSSYQTGAAGDGLSDHVSLSFDRIEVEYHPQRPDGSLDAPVKVGWDVKANRKV